MLEHQPNILLGSLARAFEFRSIMLFCLLSDLGFYLMYRCAFDLWQWQRGFKLLMEWSWRLLRLKVQDSYIILNVLHLQVEYR